MSASEYAHPVWGHVDTVYVRKAAVGHVWVTSVGSPHLPGSSSYYSGSDLCGESAWRGWERAMREANYLACKLRYNAARRRKTTHECDFCLRLGHTARANCVMNAAAIWLSEQVVPIPPEWDECR